MTAPLIAVEGLVKRFRLGSGESLAAVADVDLSADAGSVLALTGASGSGKSTLLHLIGAIERADSGTITVADTTVTALNRTAAARYRRRIGFVFQRFNLLPALTALDNVITPVLPVRTPYDKRTRGRELLDLVGLTGREDSLPSRLSGGQQQRVAIARALINDPLVLLADEPTGSLDSRTGTEIIDLLLALRADVGTTILLATHDLELAARCDRIVTLHDGRITP